MQVNGKRKTERAKGNYIIPPPRVALVPLSQRDKENGKRKTRPPHTNGAFLYILHTFLHTFYRYMQQMT